MTVTKKVITYRFLFFRYVASGYSFMTYVSLNGLASQLQAGKSEIYVSIFGLSCVHNVFPNLKQSSRK
jgi:hypothetical protein